MQTATTHALQGGFSDAPRTSAFAFRAAMGALARPGSRHEIIGATPPAPLSVAAGTLILTLCDPDTPLYLAGGCDTPDLRDWVTFHTGAPLTGPEQCAFAVGPWADLMPLARYPVGTAEYPDRSATLIVECDTLHGPGQSLQGPGIDAAGPPPSLPLPDPDAFRANAALFPLGCDFYFTAGSTLAALPRTTRVG